MPLARTIQFARLCSHVFHKNNCASILYIYLTIVVNSVLNNNIKQNMKCHCSYIIGVNKNPSAKTLNNLCGDLNKGFLPVNPMKQNVLGSPYPL